METGFMSRSTVMFVVGIAMAVGAALGMLWSSVDTTPLTVILIIGVVFIAVGARDRRTQ
jgi:low affinity Fe/Cu permease